MSSRHPYICAKAGPDAGHFMYKDTQGKIWDSYGEKHQRLNTHSFCQTFASNVFNKSASKIGLYGKRKWETSTGSKPWIDRLKVNNFTHNIIVVSTILASPV